MRKGVKGTRGLVYTTEATDPAFEGALAVFTRTDLAAASEPAGLIVPLFHGGYIAFAHGDHSATIGPEFSGGHASHDAAALAAVEMTRRAPEVRARLLAAIGESA